MKYIPIHFLSCHYEIQKNRNNMDNIIIKGFEIRGFPDRASVEIIPERSWLQNYTDGGGKILLESKFSKTIYFAGILQRDYLLERLVNSRSRPDIARMARLVS